MLLLLSSTTTSFSSCLFLKNASPVCLECQRVDAERQWFPAGALLSNNLAALSYSLKELLAPFCAGKQVYSYPGKNRQNGNEDNALH